MIFRVWLARLLCRLLCDPKWKRRRGYDRGCFNPQLPLSERVGPEAEDAEMALYVQRVQKSVDNLLPHSPSAGFSGTAT